MLASYLLAPCQHELVTILLDHEHFLLRRTNKEAHSLYSYQNTVPIIVKPNIRRVIVPEENLKVAHRITLYKEKT